MVGFVLFVELVALFAGIWFAFFFAMPRMAAESARHGLQMIELQILERIARGQLSPSGNASRLLHYVRHTRSSKGTVVEGIAARVLIPNLDRRTIDQRVLKGADPLELEMLSAYLERAKSLVAVLAVTSSIPSVLAVYPVAVWSLARMWRDRKPKIDRPVMYSARVNVDRTVMADDEYRHAREFDLMAVA